MGVRVDLPRGLWYLGGYSQARARDSLVNDSFATFGVYAESTEIKVDNVEIREAWWLDWRGLLEAWDALGRPPDKRLTSIDIASLRRGGTPPLNAEAGTEAERNTIAGNVLVMLDMWANDRGYSVRVKTETLAGKPATKAVWGGA